MDDISQSDLIIRDVLEDLNDMADQFNYSSIELKESEIPQVVMKERLNRYICVVNDCGEVAYYAKLPNTAKKNRIGGGYWVATYQEGLIWLSNQGLTGQQWNVLARMMGKLNFDNYITVNQTALANELHTRKSKISEAIKKLVERNIITEGPRAGLNKTYVLNPNLGIKGKHLKQKVIEYEELRDKYNVRKQQEKSEA